MKGHVAASYVQAFSLVQQLARLGSCRALDWPAKRTISGFVSGTVFWAAFLMPAVARSPVYGPRLRAEFWSHGNSIFWEPQCRHLSFRSLVGLLCAPILVTRFASRVRVLVSETPKLDHCTVNGAWFKGVRDFGFRE